MAHSLENYPNLLFTFEALSALSSKEFTNQEKTKILGLLDRLNRYGTDPEMIGLKKIENLGRNGWWALRLKVKTVQWRIMFRKISKTTYGITYIYKKKSSKIPKKEFKCSENLAKRESWI